MFRLLSPAPGEDVTVPAAAALVGAGTAAAERLLRTLVTTHLCEETAPGRFRSHDLLRDYAAAKSLAEDAEADRIAAVERLFSWYLHTADAASRIVSPRTVRLPLPPRDSAVAEALSADRQQAPGWLNAERTNLIAVTRDAAAVRVPRPPRPRPTSSSAEPITRLAKIPKPAPSTCHRGAQSGGPRAHLPARPICWPTSAEPAWTSASSAGPWAAAPRQGAGQAVQQALAVCKETGHRLIQAPALRALSDSQAFGGQLGEAASSAREALATCRDTGQRLERERLERVRALLTLSRLSQRSQRPETAHRQWTQAVTLAAELGMPEAAEPALPLTAIRKRSGDDQRPVLASGCVFKRP